MESLFEKSSEQIGQLLSLVWTEESNSSVLSDLNKVSEAGFLVPLFKKKSTTSSTGKQVHKQQKKNKGVHKYM